VDLRRIILPLPATYHWAEIPGEPRAWKRPGRGKYGHAYNASLKDQKAFAWQVRAALPNIRLDETSDFGVRCAFLCSQERMIHERKLILRKRKVYSRGQEHGDCDNFLKNCLDAMNGFVWADDVQVIEAFATVRECDARGPRTEILLYPIDEAYREATG